MPLLAANGSSLLTSDHGDAALVPSAYYDPVAYWAFDRGDFLSSTLIADRSGLGNSQTLNGSPTFVEGISGDAIYFGAGNTTQYTQAAAPYSLVYPFTIMAWVKFGTAPALGTFALFTIISGPLSTSDFAYLSFHGRVSGQTDVDISCSSNNQANIRTLSQHNLTGPTGRPHHIAGVFATSASFGLYVDGLQVTSPTISTVGTGLPNPVSMSIINVGASNIGSLANFVKDAWVDDVRYYSRSLLSDEIYDIALSPFYFGTSWSRFSRGNILQPYELLPVKISRIGSVVNVNQAVNRAATW